MIEFNCLIVDDEPIARDIIKNYCAHLSSLNIVGSCANAFEAKEIMQENRVDIIFLDIHMPVLSGIGFIKTIKNPPQIIFTTAFKEYASSAFDIAACDYLVKPFSLERFMVAVDKAIEKLNPKERATKPGTLETDDYFFIKADGKIYNIKYDELLFAEAKGNVTKLVTTSREILAYISFTEFFKLLPNATFIRIHRSFIINKSKISHIEGNRLFINKTELPIGSTYRQEFFKRMGL